MAYSCRWVTIYAKLSTIFVWMDIPNFYLPSGSLRGWPLAVGEGRQKSAVKNDSVSKLCSIWTCCLNAEVGGAVYSGASGQRSQVYDINLDEVGSCSCLTVGPWYTRAAYGTSNNACGTSVEVASGSTILEETARGRSMSMPITYPLTPELSLSRHSRICSY